MKNTIFFDMDGTLIDSGPGVMRCIRHTLSFYGIEKVPESELRKCVGPPLTSTFKDRFKLPETEIKRAIDIYREEYHKGGIFECGLYPGIVETLSSLKEKGYRLFVTSSKHDKACRLITDHFNITELFYDVLGSSGDGSIETKTEVLNSCFVKYKDIKKEETLLIGDTLYDAVGADESGIEFMAVTYGYGSRESLEKTSATHFFDSAKEIDEWFK